MAKLAPEQYVEELGLNCPNCGSDQIEGESVDIGAGSADQYVSCLACQARWHDIYHLVGYEDLEVFCEHGVPQDEGCQDCNDAVFQDMMEHMARDEGRN